MLSRKDDNIVAWKPGHLKLGPSLAFLSLVGFAACCIGLAVVLWDSDGKEVSTWPCNSATIPVSVLLSVLITVANLCLSFSLRKGYEISWWLQALRGAQAQKLYFDLEIRNNLFALMSQNVTIDRFVIAAVVSLVVSVLNGPLIQKSSTITSKTLHFDTQVTVRVSNASLPANFSGYSGSGYEPDLLTPLFSSVSHAYSNRENIMVPLDGCEANATCQVTLTAPGFDVSCSESSAAYDFGTLGAATPHNNITVLNVTIAFGGSYLLIPEYSTINTTAWYKPDPACSGNMIKRQCVLRLGTIRYPVSINNGVATMQPWQPGQNNTIEFTTFHAEDWMVGGWGTLFVGSDTGRFASMLGGIYYVVNELYQATTTLRLMGLTAAPYILHTTGHASSNYLTSDFSTYSNCTMTWEDPTTDLVNTVSELMLRSAIAYSNFNTLDVVPQQLAAQATRVANAYQSHYGFLAITISCMVLQAVVIFSMLLGWHRLGREVSLHAFEIARALEAPLLQRGSSNRHISEHLSSLRSIRLRYGEILEAAVHTTSRVKAGLQTQRDDYGNNWQPQPCSTDLSHQGISSEVELSHFLATDGNAYEYNGTGSDVTV